MEETLARIASQPEALLSQLEVLPQREKECVLGFGNGGTVKVESLWIEDMVAQYAQVHPEKPAVADRNGTLTYRELNDRANQLANWLRFVGVGPESRVGIMGRRSIGMLVSILGVMKAGGAYVPLDPKDPEDRMLRMMKDAGLSWLAVDNESAVSGCNL